MRSERTKADVAMNRASPRRRRDRHRGVSGTVWPVGLTVLLLSGCATPGAFVASTYRFAEATETLAGASEAYLTAADLVGLETALVQAEFAGHPVPKALLDRPFFPEEDMAARRALLAAMRGYAEALALIAEGRLGDDFRATVGRFRNDLLTFEGHLQAVSGTSRLQALQGQSAFLAEVAGAVGGMLLEHAQADALAEAILAADQPMRVAADLLEADLTLMSAKIREARALEFAIAADTVNPLLPDASLERRANLTGALRPYRDRYLASRTVGTGFEDALAGYRAAQAEITAFARAGRDPRTASQMIAAVDQFAVRARALLTMIRRGPQPVAPMPFMQETIR